MSTSWYSQTTAKSQLNLTVSDKGLAAAQEQCLRIRSLSLTTAEAPSESFAQGVVYQALANAQAASADSTDEVGMSTNGVRLYPLDRKIQAMLIIPDTDPDDATRDTGYVSSLVG